MARITAVELGADICAFAKADVRRGEVHLDAAEILDPAAFPGIEAFTTAVRQTRRSLRLPRRCHAVVWGLPDGASRKDAAVKPLIEPLTAAGFRVARVVSPCNALAALARRMKTSRGEGSTCWIGINRGGVAIVVVRPGKLLYSHSFAWDSSVGSSGSQARLLQRYSLVAFLSPEIKRAIAESRKFGTPVDCIVTCGNLPELRSLTMPLIEELDVEVETLDSLDGLVVKPEVVEKLGEWAPAIRIACAAVIARGTRPWDPSKKRTNSRALGGYLRAAALAAAVVGIGYLWYAKIRSAPPAPVVTARATPPAASVPAPAVSDAARKPESNPKKPESNPKTMPPPVGVPSTNLPPNPASATTAAGPPTPSAKAEGGSYMVGKGAAAPALSVPAKKPESKGAVSVPSTKPESNPKKPESKSAASVPAPPVSLPTKKPESNPKKAESNPPAAKTPPPAIPWKPAPAVMAPPRSVPTPAVSVAAKKPESNPKKPESNPPAVVSVPPPAAKAPVKSPAPVAVVAKKPESKGPVSVPPPAVSVPAKKTESNPPAVSVPAKKTESNPPAVSVPAKKTESNPLAVSVPAKKTESNPKPPAKTAPIVAAASTVPRVRIQPLVTMPSPNTPAPRAPRPSAPAPAVRATRPPVSAPAPVRPAVSAPAPLPRVTPATLNPPVVPADKPQAGSASVSSPIRPAQAGAAPRGPMPARLTDAVPRVTAILVSRDRRFATIDGGQIIGIGDLLGRRMVVGMDERSVVLQEPSGVQIRVGLGGRLLGIERAAR